MCRFRQRKPRDVSWDEAMGALGRAAPMLRDDLDTRTTGRAGLIVSPAAGATGADTASELERVLAAAEALDGAEHHIQTDEHNHAWLILEAQGLEALASSMARAVALLQAGALAGHLLAAVFPITWNDRTLYWICHVKTGRFTPFVPLPGEDQLRDYPLEIRMEATLRKGIPTDRDQSRWYPLWGIPI